jgi:hypothetical protein
MAWETRGNKRYFYRKERIGKKVKTCYIGIGELAEFIAESENAGKLERKLERERKKRRRIKSEIIDEQIKDLSQFNQSLVEALFLLNGYRQHKRQWRKKR